MDHGGSSLFLKETARPTAVFISNDKNRRQARTETAAKKVFRILSEAHPDLKFSLLRREGVVTIDRKPLARVKVAPGDVPISLLWDNEILATTTIDKKLINKAFEERFFTANGAVQWAV